MKKNHNPHPQTSPYPQSPFRPLLGAILREDPQCHRPAPCGRGGLDAVPHLSGAEDHQAAQQRRDVHLGRAVRSCKAAQKNKTHCKYVLFCIALLLLILYCTVLYCIVLYHIILYYVISYCIMSYYSVLCCIILYDIVTYCMMLYHIILYHIILYAILYYTIL